MTDPIGIKEVFIGLDGMKDHVRPFRGYLFFLEHVETQAEGDANQIDLIEFSLAVVDSHI